MNRRQKRLKEYRETEGKRWELLHDKYRGERCFVIGNGPSLNNQDLKLLANEFTIAVNQFIRHEDFSIINPDLYCICAEQLFGAKTRVWLPPEAIQFNSLIYELWQTKPNTITWVFPWYYKVGIEKHKLFPSEKVRYVFWETPWDLIQDTKKINLDIANQPLQNGRTIIINLCLPVAFYLGFSEVYLLGCDSDYYMESYKDQPKHFYGGKTFAPRTPFEYERLQKIWGDGGYVFRNYRIVKEQFERAGRRIFNATEGGKLEVFEKVELSDCFNRR